MPPTTIQPPASPQAQAVSSAWRLTAWVAAVFSVLVALGMLWGHFRTKAADPLHSHELTQAREKLRLTPNDEPLKQQIRRLDLQLRQSYFRQLSQRALGVYFLLGGAGLFIVAVTQLSRGPKQPLLWLPKLEATGPTARAARRARWAVATSGTAIGALLFNLSLGLTTPLPKSEAQIDKLLGTEPGAGTATAAAAPDAASPEELKQNWPCFRGIAGGFSLLTNVPATWDAKTGAGIAWKTAAPASGFNSPIVWGNRVFFSGGDAAKREVFCLDGKSGQLLWRQAVANVPGSPTQPPEISESTGYAAPTMATDGRRVYVMFANGDVATFTLEGKPVWSKGFGALKNTYGHANSLCTWRDRLIIQLDQGDSEEGKSKLYALDGRTGQIVWQQPRKVGASWASPIVIEAAGKPQVIVLSVPWAIAYSATDGKELWRVECLNGEVTPSPAFAGGLVLVASPSEKLLAIRPDGQGDVTKTHVAWFMEENVPDVTSPASSGELVFTVTTSGLLSCFDLKDGKKQWEHDLDMECHASPVVAGNRVYLFSQKGRAVVVEAARQYKELFRTEMEDAFHATPAFGPSGMVLRGLKDVWCVAEKK